MRIPFQEHHLLNALGAYEKQNRPLDQFLNQYFRTHKALGSKDRAFIAETIYSMVRWLGLIDYELPLPLSWEKRYSKYKKNQFIPKLIEELEFLLSQRLEFLPHEAAHSFTMGDAERLKVQDDGLAKNRLFSSLGYPNISAPSHVQVSFPQELYDLIHKSHGNFSDELCLQCNIPAPITVRINPIKTTREELLKKWHDCDIFPTPSSPFGITFKKRIALFSLPEFKNGFFEMQDEGSQLLAQMIQAQPGDKILDFCSGSGGKTLGFAHLTQGKGQIYLHDIRKSALEQARKRLNRAGIQNAQFLLAQDPSLEKLKKKMDWVLVDAPCSGTGTLRRNPDMKWRFCSQMLKNLVSEQRMIFEKALSFLESNGTIVYATCSLLKEENEEQVAHFLRTYPIKLEKELFQSLPTAGGMDGFFAASFKRTH